MTEYHPHPYQAFCTNAIIEKPAVALWLEMGLGKTIITLTAIADLLYNRFAVRRVLIIAPKKVAEATWQDEAGKWAHTAQLQISTVLGTAKQRAAALAAEADVYIINQENVVWLVNYYGRRWPFDMVVIDEATAFKSHTAQRFKALKRVRPRIRRVVELTGTPAPHGYLDLWAQMLLLDQGERLGTRYTAYRQQYFDPDKRNGMQVYSWKAKPGAEAEIRAAVADVCISLKAEDYLQMPDKLTEDIPVVLDAAAAKAYRQMETTALLEADGEIITAMQAGALTNKLLQLCNGAAYDETGSAHIFNRCKADALAETINALDGQKALVFYAFRFDRDVIAQTIQEACPGRCARFLRTAADAADWNAGKIDILLAQPTSTAYGLNLQAGGHHVIWYSLPWRLDLYEQGIARLYRQGQPHPVIVHRLLVKGGADELVARSLEYKGRSQDALMQALKARITAAHRGGKTK